LVSPTQHRVQFSMLGDDVSDLGMDIGGTAESFVNDRFQP
jgi:hypothetical protein